MICKAPINGWLIMDCFWVLWSVLSWFYPNSFGIIHGLLFLWDYFCFSFFCPNCLKFSSYLPQIYYFYFLYTRSNSFPSIPMLVIWNITMNTDKCTQIPAYGFFVNNSLESHHEPFIIFCWGTPYSLSAMFLSDSSSMLMQVSWCWARHAHKPSIWCTMPMWLLPHSRCWDTQTGWPYGELFPSRNSKNKFISPLKNDPSPLIELMPEAGPKL